MRFAAWLALIASLACRTAPRPPSSAASGGGGSRVAGPVAFPPQPGTVIGEVDGVAVLALSAPRFAQLERDQRLFAWQVAQALAAGDTTTLDQGYRHNLAIARLLRGILSRADVVPAPIQSRLREYARAIWLNHGIHDAVSGRKRLPGFTASQLRLAALSAQAAGAELSLRGARLEYALRALDGPLFDPRVDAQRTSHLPDPLLHSAVNLYGSVSLRDLQGFREQFPQNSRLAREGGALAERVYRLPQVADGLQGALPLSAPPQRAVLEPLAAFFRSGEPAAFRDASLAWLDEAGPVDFFAGFLDTSADPRGRKGLYGGVIGVADPERGALLDELLHDDESRAGKAAFLAAASGAFRPLLRGGLTVSLSAGAKSLLFGAAEDAAAALREPKAIAALAPPEVARDLAACARQQRFAFLALRELYGRFPPGNPVEESGALREARADLAGWSHAPGPLLSARCAQLHAQYAATSWLASVADLPEGDRVDGDRDRAILLQLWWFKSRGALVERKSNGGRFFSVPDEARFRAAAQELDAVLSGVGASRDTARLDEMLASHASQVDASLREEVGVRLRAAGVPRRVALVAPRIEPVLQEGKVVDARAVPIESVDAEILRDWAQL